MVSVASRSGPPGLPILQRNLLHLHRNGLLSAVLSSIIKSNIKDICVIGMPDQIAMYRAKAGTNCFSRVYLAMYTAATRHLY